MHLSNDDNLQVILLVVFFYFHSRIFDEASNDRNRQESSAHRNLDRQNSASNLLAHQGRLIHIYIHSVKI